MGQSRTTRAATFFLWLSVWVVSLPTAAVAPAHEFQAPWATHRQLNAWLKSQYVKAKKDSERLVQLTGTLRQEALKRKPNPLTPKLLDRIEELEARAQELHSDVEELDENILPVGVVVRAEAIRDEAKSLRVSFNQHSSDRWWKKLRDLARQIEKRADSVHDRLRYP